MSNSIKQQKTYITILNYLTDQLEKKRENNDYIHWNIYNLKLAYGENDSSLNPQKGEFRDQEDDYDILCNNIMDMMDSETKLYDRFNYYSEYINLYFTKQESNNKIILPMDLFKQLDLDLRMNPWIVYCLCRAYEYFCVTPDKKLYDEYQFQDDREDVIKTLDKHLVNETIKMKFMEIADTVTNDTIVEVQYKPPQSWIKYMIYTGIALVAAATIRFYGRKANVNDIIETKGIVKGQVCNYCNKIH